MSETKTDTKALTNSPSSPIQIPKNWKLVVDKENIARCVSRMTYEILEKGIDLRTLAVVGIRTGGEFLAQRIAAKINEIERIEVPFGVIDITLYRDDLSSMGSQPVLKGTDLPFPVSGASIVLVDDVLYTGRTIRAALDAIIDFGRPKRVYLAVLVDRGHRELPIRADFVGKNMPSSNNESLHVRFQSTLR